MIWQVEGNYSGISIGHSLLAEANLIFLLLNVTLFHFQVTKFPEI